MSKLRSIAIGLSWLWASIALVAPQAGNAAPGPVAAGNAPPVVVVGPNTPVEPLPLKVGGASRTPTPAPVPAFPALSLPPEITGTVRIATPPPVPALREVTLPLDLSQARLYIYDFLDIREKVYRPQVLDEIERQLLEMLTPQTQAVTILRSQQTPFMIQRNASNWQAEISTEHQVERVPVLDAIASNFSAEQQFGADYQLIVFPSSFESYGVWRYYSIRFVVIRKSDQKSWEYNYDGRHAVMLKEAERANSRAEKIVQGLAAAMTGYNLIKAKAP